MIGAKTYKLAANNGPNTLHGGAKGFDSRWWTVVEKLSFITGGVGQGVRLTYFSKDGEEGFPG